MGLWCGQGTVAPQSARLHEAGWGFKARSHLSCSSEPLTAQILSALPDSPAGAPPPTHSSALQDPTSALSSLLALGTSSLSRAGSTRLCLQEKPLPETWREMSKRVMLMRVPIWFLARKVGFGASGQEK